MAKPQDFLDKKGKWACTQCGACCKAIWPLVNKGVFPRQWMNKKGGCTNQMKSGKCRIYDRRPSYCHINKSLTDLQIAEMCAVMKTEMDRQNV